MYNMSYNSRYLHTQNDVLMKHLLTFYQHPDHVKKLTSIIRGETNISLRIVDWFVTNYSKKYFVVYQHRTSSSRRTPTVSDEDEVSEEQSMCHERFKVYNDYKLKLKAYSKRRFDPFQRWGRIEIPDTTTAEGAAIETTIGQLNFFKWAIENRIIEYIQEHYEDIERDMNLRNSTSKKRSTTDAADGFTRKKREELSISATKCIKKEQVKIIVTFS